VQRRAEESVVRCGLRAKPTFTIQRIWSGRVAVARGRGGNAGPADFAGGRGSGRRGWWV